MTRTGERDYLTFRPRDQRCFDPSFVRRVKTSYTRYGWDHTTEKFGLQTQQMAWLVREHNMTPYPRDHIALTELSASLGRPLNTIAVAAEAAGVLRRTIRPGSKQAGIRSVPKRWAWEYAAIACAYDHVREKIAAGWLRSTDIAEMFATSRNAVRRAAEGHGALAEYVGHVKRSVATNGHAAWEPWGIAEAHNRWKAETIRAKDMLTTREVGERVNRHHNAVRQYAHRYGIEPVRLWNIKEGQPGLFFTREQADQIARLYADTKRSGRSRAANRMEDAR